MKSKLAVSSVKDAVLSQKALPICQLVATVAQSATVKANRSPGKVTSCIFQRLTGEIPASEILTSASLHDSLVAIPLMQMNDERLGFYCYYLMDSAYDAKEIHEFSRNMGRLPIMGLHQNLWVNVRKTAFTWDTAEPSFSQELNPA